MASLRQRMVDILRALGREDYVICEGRRVDIMFRNGTEMVWYRGTIMHLRAPENVEIWFDDGDTQYFPIHELEEMVQKAEIRMAKAWNA
jgi:hypothetical protein